MFRQINIDWFILLMDGCKHENLWLTFSIPLFSDDLRNSAASSTMTNWSTFCNATTCLKRCTTMQSASIQCMWTAVNNRSGRHKLYNGRSLPSSFWWFGNLFILIKTLFMTNMRLLMDQHETELCWTPQQAIKAEKSMKIYIKRIDNETNLDSTCHQNCSSRHRFSSM